MTKDQIKETVLRVLGQIAPEANLSQIKPDLGIRTNWTLIPWTC
jgi:hypothetical protein